MCETICKSKCKGLNPVMTGFKLCVIIIPKLKVKSKSKSPVMTGFKICVISSETFL